MSIRIVPESEIVKTAGDFVSPPLLFANPKNLYQRRIKRLNDLAKNNPLKEYLQFVVHIVEAQLYLLETRPIPTDPRLTKEFLTADYLAQMPLHVTKWQRDPIWISLLKDLLAFVKPYATQQALDTIEKLEKSSQTELNTLADALLKQEFEQVSSDKAIFIWATLSLYWLQLAQQLPHQATTELGEKRHFCPVCHSTPIASVVQIGTKQGLRYLHCSLCESQWHMVRSKCSNCEQTGKIDYWSLDSEFAAVKAETCGDCHSYLKVVYQEKDPHVEPVADDLSTLYLDLEMEEKGFAKSTVNPFIFPSGE